MNTDVPPPSPSDRSVSSPTAPDSPTLKGISAPTLIEKELRMVEARLVRMENYLGFRQLTVDEAEAILGGGSPLAAAAPTSPIAVSGEGELEMQIGEYWLARVGVLALSLGTAFLVAYPFSGLPSFVSSLIGYVATAVFFASSRRMRQARPDASGILYAGALFLLFFATLRLHFFSLQPVVESPGAGLALLAAAVGVVIWLAVRSGGELLTGISFAIGMAAVAVADVAWFQFALLVVLAWTGFAVVKTKNWPGLGLAVAGLTYLLHIDWLLNNPLLGHTLQGVSEPQGNLIALAAYTVPIIAPGFRSGASSDHLAIRIARALLTSGGTMLIALLNAQLFYSGTLPWVEAGAAAGLLLTAFAYWRHHQSVYATSIYACAGYMMLSMAIVRHLPAPGFYGWLAWQSLLVAATAVGYRSKIIVVANLFIFGGIYFTYLLLGEATGPVNLSFAAVALLTARVLNWKKANLDLRTELMRNLYLGAATIVIPYGLFHTVPKGLVSTSWLAAAICYLIVSAVLKNRKYRVMGIGTILATVVYVFVVDLSRLEAAYRIISFLVLGVVLVGVSVAYTKQRRKERGATGS